MKHCGFMTTAALSYRSRALSAAAVALPIPLLAALGLSLPLPATVARLAARLVPFADDGARASVLRGGTIVTRPGEAEPVRVRVRDASGHTRVISVPRASLTKRELVTTAGKRVVIVGTEAPPTVDVPKTTTAARPSQSPDNTPATAAVAPASSAAPAPTTTSTPTVDTTTPPKPAPTPTQQVVNTVTTAVDNTVSSVPNTVNNTVTTVTGTAQNTVGGLLGGKKP
jgi:hypothetical protein